MTVIVSKHWCSSISALMLSLFFPPMLYPCIQNQFKFLPSIVKRPCIFEEVGAPHFTSWTPEDVVHMRGVRSTGAREVGKAVLMAENVRSPFDYREPPTLDSDGDGSKPPPPRGWVSTASPRLDPFFFSFPTAGDFACKMRKAWDARAGVRSCAYV